MQQLQQIADQIKIAREKAVTACYEESLKIYDAALGQLRDHVQTTKSQNSKSMWSNVEKNIEKEYQLIQKHLKDLQKFQGNEAAFQQSPLYSNESQFQLQYANPNYKNNAPSNKPKAFAYHEVQNNFQQNNFQQNNDKSPAWDGNLNYDQKPKNVQRKKTQQPNNNVKNKNPVARKVSQENVNVKKQPEKEDKRNYDRPWKVNKPEVQQKEPTTFLEWVTQNYGRGLDDELIAGLEREIVDRSPNIKFEDIAGLTEAKSLLNEAVFMPLKFPEIFIGIRKPWKGILLFGPPGTGKTMLAKAVASKCGTTFICASPATLANKYRGESEKLVRYLFQMARFYAPSVIFFDEIDALASIRGDTDHEASRRVKCEMLSQMDGIISGNENNIQNTAQATDPEQKTKLNTVTIVAATNRPWDLDPAFIRRLEKRICKLYNLDIPLPDQLGRRQLLELNLSKNKIESNLDWNHIVEKSKNFSGHDIVNLCRDAAMVKIRELMKKLSFDKGDPLQIKQIAEIPISNEDFAQALQNVQPSVSSVGLEKFEEWMKEFGSS